MTHEMDGWVREREVWGSRFDYHTARGEHGLAEWCMKMVRDYSRLIARELDAR